MSLHIKQVDSPMAPIVSTAPLHRQAITPCPPRLYLAASSGVVMLLYELGAFSLRHDCRDGRPYGTSLGQHLLSTAFACRLGWGEDSVLADACTLHSVYGTSRFRHVLAGASLRCRVAAVAGARAERLAYLFGAIARPACLLALAELATPTVLLPLHAQPGAGVAVSAEDVQALLCMEASNLVDQGDAFLLRVQQAPQQAPLRLAVQHLHAAAASVRASLPPIVLYSPAPPLPSGMPCCPSLWSLLRPQPPPPPSVQLQPTELPALTPLPSQELPGCCLLDSALGGPLIPPHLTPLLHLLPPSPLHAALPQQQAGPQQPTPAATVHALEAGQCSTPATPPGRTVTATELRQAVAALDKEGAAAAATAPAALAAELVSLLATHGYLCLDVHDSGAVHAVASAFGAAAQFFARPPADKQKARWPSGPSRKHAGFRAEGARELFAVREDRGQAGTGAGAGAEGAAEWPEAQWRALFELQQGLCRDVLRLLALGVGLPLCTAGQHAEGEGCGGGAAGMPCLAALLAAEGSSSSSSSSSSSASAVRTASAASADSADSATATPEACADVMRVYRYSRPAGGLAPGLRTAATSAHADVGLLTLAPLSTVPGLVLLSPCGRHWVDCEGEEEGRRGPCAGSGQRFVCFLGEAGARLLAGAGVGVGVGGAAALRAPVHFVLERGSSPRYSAPFFLRAPSSALLAPGLTNVQFLHSLVQRPWARMRDREPVGWASDF